MILADIAARPLAPYWFRGKGRLFNLLCPNWGTKEATLFGYTVRLDLSDLIQRNVYLGTYEPEESSLIRRFLRSGITFVDVGANVGYYSLMAAAAAGPSGRVVAIEPNPDLCEGLEETIRNNRIRNMILEQAAVGKETGWADLFVPTHPGNNTATLIPNGGGSPIRVRVITLDEYLEQQQIATVDFLKIDVEGFEDKVLEGARCALRAKRIRAVLCEFNGTWLRARGATPRDCFDLIRSFGLRPVQQPSKHDLEFGNVLFFAD